MIAYDLRQANESQFWDLCWEYQETCNAGRMWA